MPFVRSTRLCKAECRCKRIIRISKAVYEQGPIICMMCSTVFKMSVKDVQAIEAVQGRWPVVVGIGGSGENACGTCGEAFREPEQSVEHRHGVIS